MANELQDFLANYAKAYQSYDRDRVAELFSIPCIFYLKNETTLLENQDRLESFLDSGLRAYREHGCVHFNASLLSGRRIGPRFALIDVEWSPTDADGKRAMHFQTTYNLVKETSGWKVAVITRHDS